MAFILFTLLHILYTLLVYTLLVYTLFVLLAELVNFPVGIVCPPLPSVSALYCRSQFFSSDLLSQFLT